MHGAVVAASPSRPPARQLGEKPLLRFITCGSVDDGKSTLIGRLLYDADLAPDDIIAALESDSKKHGTQGEALDFALLVDGLAAEREQGRQRIVEVVRRVSRARARRDEMRTNALVVLVSECGHSYDAAELHPLLAARMQRRQQVRFCIGAPVWLVVGRFGCLRLQRYERA